MMSFQKSISCFFLLCLLHVGLSHALPARGRKPKSAALRKKPTALIDPVASAFAAKIHKNAILASAYNMPYGYAPLGAAGMGLGLTSFSNYGGGYGYPFFQDHTAAYPQAYVAAYPGSYTNSHESQYTNHLGFPNGYSVNTEAAYAPNAFGYPAIGGKKTSYDKVNSHLGGSARVSGVSYTGHNGLGRYNYGTHQEHVNLPGLTKVTYTHRYPVHPAYGTYASFGNMGYY